jgi:hypothetical protein
LSLPGPLVVDFWDIGQGDASVITLPSGELIIIDTGEDACLQKWLKRKTPHIHTIVITHNDEDHCGRLNDILNDYQGPRLNLWIVNDQHKSTLGLQQLFSSIPRHERSRKILTQFISVNSSITRLPIFHSPCGNIQLDAIFPSVIALTAIMPRSSPNPNSVSAILTLTLEGTLQIVWAGDAPMAVVTEVCNGMTPKVLVGPHHGAPLDRPTPRTSLAHNTAYRNAFQVIQPERVFVSVGTDNKDSHPVKRDFIDLHRALGRQVVCSQTHHCGRKQIRADRPLLGNHLALGLEPPEAGVSCRGPMRLTWMNSAWTDDVFHQLHATAIQGLRPAYCL